MIDFNKINQEIKDAKEIYNQTNSPRVRDVLFNKLKEGVGINVNKHKGRKLFDFTKPINKSNGDSFKWNASSKDRFINNFLNKFIEENLLVKDYNSPIGSAYENLVRDKINFEYIKMGYDTSVIKTKSRLQDIAEMTNKLGKFGGEFPSRSQAISFLTKDIEEGVLKDKKIKESGYLYDDYQKLENTIIKFDSFDEMEELQDPDIASKDLSLEDQAIQKQEEAIQIKQFDIIRKTKNDIVESLGGTPEGEILSLFWENGSNNKEIARQVFGDDSDSFRKRVSRTKEKYNKSNKDEFSILQKRIRNNFKDEGLDYSDDIIKNLDLSNNL